MKLIKRCYGCGKAIWPWQDTVYTKLVGHIHRECAYSVCVMYPLEKETTEYISRLNVRALKKINEEEEKM